MAYSAMMAHVGLLAIFLVHHFSRKHYTFRKQYRQTLDMEEFKTNLSELVVSRKRNAVENFLQHVSKKPVEPMLDTVKRHSTYLQRTMYPSLFLWFLHKLLNSFHSTPLHIYQSLEKNIAHKSRSKILQDFHFARLVAITIFPFPLAFYVRAQSDITAILD